MICFAFYNFYLLFFFKSSVLKLFLLRRHYPLKTFQSKCSIGIIIKYRHVQTYAVFIKTFYGKSYTFSQLNGLKALTE